MDGRHDPVAAAEPAKRLPALAWRAFLGLPLFGELSNETIARAKMRQTRKPPRAQRKYSAAASVRVLDQITHCRALFPRGACCFEGSATTLFNKLRSAGVKLTRHGGEITHRSLLSYLRWFVIRFPETVAKIGTEGQATVYRIWRTKCVGSS